MAEAFLYSESIDVTTYGRQRDRLREELTLAKIDHHAEAVEELDVEGILAFAERILPRASDLWVQGTTMVEFQQAHDPRPRRPSSGACRALQELTLSTGWMCSVRRLAATSTKTRATSTFSSNSTTCCTPTAPTRTWAF